MQTKRGSIHSNSGSIQTKPGSIQTKPGSIQTKRGSKLLEPGSIQSGGDQSSMFGINSVPTRSDRWQHRSRDVDHRRGDCMSRTLRTIALTGERLGLVRLQAVQVRRVSITRRSFRRHGGRERRCRAAGSSAASLITHHPEACLQLLSALMDISPTSRVLGSLYSCSVILKGLILSSIK